jgi:tetratricopeptide (TPR) repeat protein
MSKRIKNSVSLFAAVLATVALVACKSDPQAKAREHLAKGEEQLANKKLPEAIIEYRRAVQSDPRLGQARLRLAEAYAETGESVNALREFARAAELLPDDNDAQLKAGHYMLLAGLYQDVKGLAERMLARTPGNVDAQILIANALAGGKDMDGAIAAFHKAIEMDPKRAGTYADLGAAEAIRGDTGKAEEAFRKALETDANSLKAHVALANFRWAQGKLPEAEQSLKRALELDPKNVLANRAIASLYTSTRRPELAEPHMKTLAEVAPGLDADYDLADYYVRSGRIDSARDVLKPLLANNDAFVAASIRLAGVEVQAKKNAEAHRLLEAVLARDPKNVEALVARSKLQLLEGNTVNALSGLQTAAEANPRSIDARVTLARTYALRGSLKEAMATYNEALSLDGNNLEARLGLAQLQINNGKAAEAVPLLLKVVEQQPGNLNARLALFQGLMAVGDLPLAERQLAVLQQVSPDSATVQTAAGALAMMKKDQAGARAAYSRALAADPRSYQALAGLLTAEMQSKNLGGAKALIDKQLALMPNDPNVLLMGAQTYEALGDNAEMEKLLKKTVEADAQSLQAYAMLGKMYYQQGRLDLARRELERYVTTAPLSVPGNTMLATILELQGRKDDAKARYNKVLQIDPRAAVAANNLAWLDANSDGNLDVALQLAQTAKAQLPSRHEVDDTLGWIYYKKGLSSMAVDSFSNSTLRQPDNPIYNYHLALAHHANGNKQEARKALEKALASKTNFAGADEAKKLLESIKG